MVERTEPFLETAASLAYEGHIGPLRKGFLDATDIPHIKWDDRRIWMLLALVKPRASLVVGKPQPQRQLSRIRYSLCNLLAYSV
jgi:hypothetical protein